MPAHVALDVVFESQLDEIVRLSLGLGFRIQESEFRVQCSEFRVYGLDLRI